MRERLAEGVADVREELAELREEMAGAADAVREDIAATPLARRAVASYLWVMSRAPTSTRGRVLAALALIVLVMTPSLVLLYVTLTEGSGATESWFGRLGYAGVFLSNMAGTGTVFIPVPGLTAAAQTLIASSAQSLSPFMVGLLGGLGMAVGEITAYVAGMAGAEISKEEGLKAPRPIRPAVERLVRGVDWLMDRYGMPTLFLLAAVPNPLFEVAGLTAGATRYSFRRFMAAVTPGKVLRGLIIAYVGERFIFG
ncbi:MAG TPA: VTT domain-containing protein [Dehalococcoidia bacterium]|nr:VTT domain-containing protein [Dehalococcoidia bacterium]